MVKEHITKIPRRKQDTHKGDFGHVFVVAGSRGMTGAAYLASQAAILSGCGLVTCGIPESLNAVMEIKLTEVMTLAFPEIKEGALALEAADKICAFSKNSDSLALGPGISRHKETQRLVKKVLKKVDKPVVLDADGIIAIAGNAEMLKKRKAPTILTPHPGEMSYLIGKGVPVIQQDRVKVALDFAKKFGVIVALKGRGTVIADPKGETYVNKTGNSGMSTAGVGDVLTGMIASFIAQGVNPYSAVVTGVYFHGMAGDVAAKEKGQYSLIATDLLDSLPRVIKNVL